MRVPARATILLLASGASQGAACRRAAPPPVAATVVIAPDSPRAVVAPSDASAAVPPAPHGGTLVRATDGFVEAAVEPGGRLRVWRFDEALRPRSLAATRGAASVPPARAVEIPLVYDPRDDSLLIQLAPPREARFAVRVSLSRADAGALETFELTLPVRPTAPPAGAPDPP